MTDDFPYIDELGPRRIVHLYEPSVNLRAVVVVDNVAAGPAIGGVRMAPDVTTEECARLARAMTLKNAAAGLAHGGGKAVIVGDPHAPGPEKERLVRAFAALIADLVDYIPGPDMGTDETCMAWIHDEIGRAVALPREIGGIPLDEIGATGFGLVKAIEAAQDRAGLAVRGARVVVQGFGSVGRHASRLLAGQGAVLVGVADSSGTLADPDGLDVNALLELKASGRHVTEAGFGTKLDGDAIIGLDCDVWIPAARPDVITMETVDRVRARLIAPGANIPMTDQVAQLLHERGVLVLPDFIANAGGVICAAVEYHGGSETQVFDVIADKVGRNVGLVLERSATRGVAPRTAAVDLAVERVRAAMRLRRWP